MTTMTERKAENKAENTIPNLSYWSSYFLNKIKELRLAIVEIEEPLKENRETADLGDISSFNETQATISGLVAIKNTQITAYHNALLRIQNGVFGVCITCTKEREAKEAEKAIKENLQNKKAKKPTKEEIARQIDKSMLFKVYVSHQELEQNPCRLHCSSCKILR